MSIRQQISKILEDVKALQALIDGDQQSLVEALVPRVKRQYTKKGLNRGFGTGETEGY